MADDTPTATARCTAAEALERERQVARWVVEGWSPHDICEKGADAWGIGPQQVRRYYQRVIAAMREANTRERADLVEEHTARREAIYRRLLAIADNAPVGEPDVATRALVAARAVLTDLARLQSLYAADRASLARAGLDQQLTHHLGEEAAKRVRDLLRSAYTERTRRGFPPPAMGEPADAEPADEDDYDGGDLGDEEP